MIQTERRYTLERDELVLHYQPKVKLPERRICGVETGDPLAAAACGLVPAA